jgi:hypothetical protein
MPRRPNSGRARVPASVAAIVFALLVLATVGAFAYAQRVKRDPLVIDRVKLGFEVKTKSGATKQRHSFTPNGDCRHDKIPIRFRTTVSDQGTVQIIKPSGRVVYTLARDVFLKRYRFHRYYWDGRQRGGGTARPGRYKLRVKLLGEGRTLVVAGPIKLHKPTSKRPSACSGGSGGLRPPAEGTP